MAVGRKIQKLIDTIDWDRFNGWGTVNIVSAGLKYLTVYVEGDWKHMHGQFTRVLNDVADRLGIKVEVVDFLMINDDGGDFYGGNYKILVN